MHPTKKNDSQTSGESLPQSNNHGPSLASTVAQLGHVGERLHTMEATIADLAGKVEQTNRQLATVAQGLSELLQLRTVKDYYTTAEAAKILGKAEFTVREWCRNGRVRAEKKGSGRGKYQSWVVSHAELRRIQRDGLLPIPRLGVKAD